MPLLNLSIITEVVGKKKAHSIINHFHLTLFIILFDLKMEYVLKSEMDLMKLDSRNHCYEEGVLWVTAATHRISMTG